MKKMNRDKKEKCPVFASYSSLSLSSSLHIGDSSCARLGLGSVYSMPSTTMVGMKP